jgi:ADP-ribosyl-[dinitrogen reductase] hydrolase
MEHERNRALGAFVGLAVGDALGAPVEFKEPGEFAPVTDYAYSYVWQIPPGYWTDDTSMAVCLAESIIHKGDIDPTDILMRFVRWYKHGENSPTGVCFDIGSTTRSNIERFIRDQVATPAPNHYYQSGNGGIMRLAPVAVRWWQDVYKTEQASITQSITTHGSDECQNCARDLGNILARAIQGQPVWQELNQQLADVPPRMISNSGRASDTFLAAKWCVATTNSFEDAVCKAVNLGGDADTIGAVTGQIAGSIYGLSSIPERWKQGLFDYARLVDLAEMLFDKDS